MAYQTYVSYFQIPGFPGDEHNNDRHASIYRSGVNTTKDLEPGVVQVVTGLYDHTRVLLSDPTATNIAAPGAYIGIVARGCNESMDFNSRQYIGSTTPSTSLNVVPQFEHVRLKTNGTIYAYVEKAINPSLPVYVRVANAVGTSQAVGFLTDTASGADTVLLPNARWYGTDVASYMTTKDINFTPALIRSNLGMARAYSYAPVQIRFGGAIAI